MLFRSLSERLLTSAVMCSFSISSIKAKPRSVRPVSVLATLSHIHILDNVVFVNTENVCLGQSLLVRLAVQLRDAGKTITQIAADLDVYKRQRRTLQAGGRH